VLPDRADPRCFPAGLDEDVVLACQPMALTGNTRQANATKKSVAGRRRKTSEDDGLDPVEREARVRERIIQAAAATYRELGYEAASMAHIAKRIGMTAPALYWYFGSKEDILFAFLEHTIEHLYRFTSDSVNPQSPPRVQMWELMRAYALWQLQKREMSDAYDRIYSLGHLRNSLPPRRRTRIKALERQFYELFRDVVHAARQAEGVTDPDAAESKAIAFAMIGMVEHLNPWFKSKGTLSMTHLAGVFANLAVRMVMPLGSPVAVASAPRGRPRR